MNLIKWSEDVMKKFKWYDIKLAQLSAIFAILTILTLWPAFQLAALKVAWYWYLLLAIIFGAPIVKRMFSD